MASKIKQFKAELNEKISKEIMAIRIPHTKATSETAMNIASRMDSINKFDLHSACVLHDIAKELSYETMVKIIINAKGNPLLDEVIGKIEIGEYDSPKWLHGIVGAIVAHDVYGITSKDVLTAIRYHKVGNISDPLFTKILITADIANPLRQARYMIAAYTALKMRKYEYDDVYQNIIKYDTYVAVCQEDVVIPRMLQGTSLKINKLNKCPALMRLGDYYDEDREFVWMPYPNEGEWVPCYPNGIYLTPNGFENAMLVLDTVDHPKKKEIILTLSEKDWTSYMITVIKDGEENQHMILPINDPHRPEVKLPRRFVPLEPTRYLTIDAGEYQTIQ